MTHAAASEMAPIKLLSTDLDGTIIFDGAVRPDDAAAMRAWRDAGHLLVMNTGRSNTALASALDGFDVPYDYAVLYTGAGIFDAAGRVLYAQTLPDGLVDEVLETLKDEGPLTLFATTLQGDWRLFDSMGVNTELLTLFKEGSTDDFAGTPVVGIPLHLSSPEETSRVLQLVHARWADVLDGARNQDFLDLIPAGATKGAGLQRLIEMLTGPGGPYEGRSIETYAVGDSWNDMSMHAVADHPIAMAGAPRDVSDLCERCTPSVAALIESILGEENN